MNGENACMDLIKSGGSHGHRWREVDKDWLLVSQCQRFYWSRCVIVECVQWCDEMDRLAVHLKTV